MTKSIKHAHRFDEDQGKKVVAVNKGIEDDAEVKHIMAPITDENNPATSLEEFVLKLENGDMIKKDITEFVGNINTEDSVLLAQISENIRRSLPQIMAYDHQPDAEIIIAAGGPSMKNNFSQLKKLYDSGIKVVSVNGTHDWLMERGVRPSVHIMLDAREWNKKFVQNPIPTCKYLIASQCHPAVFDALENNEVIIWHNTYIDGVDELLDEYYMKRWFPVPGGSTVMLNAIPIMRILGFEKMHIFGFDSCYIDDEHHSYVQDEQHSNIAFIDYRGRIFKTEIWMAKQASEFIQLIRNQGEMYQLNVIGDGMIAYIIEKAAEDADSMEAQQLLESTISFDEMKKQLKEERDG